MQELLVFLFGVASFGENDQNAFVSGYNLCRGTF